MPLSERARSSSAQRQVDAPSALEVFKVTRFTNSPLHAFWVIKKPQTLESAAAAAAGLRLGEVRVERHLTSGAGAGAGACGPRLALGSGSG